MQRLFSQGCFQDKIIGCINMSVFNLLEKNNEGNLNNTNPIYTFYPKKEKIFTNNLTFYIN